MVPELEHMLKLGEEKALWRLSYRNLAALALGLLLGGQLAQAWGWTGLPVAGLGALCGGLGLWLTLEQRRVLRAVRLWLLARLLLRQWAGHTVDADQWYTAPAEARPQIRARRWSGQPRLVVRTPVGARVNGHASGDKDGGADAPTADL